jgi:BirA family transcriptional regulator, biotin operon repressor / biotin---[acetyl-CoA-carboxylase] ligase
MLDSFSINAFDEVTSTQETAKEHLKAGKLVHGTVISAFNQTNARGRNNSLWISDRGNIALTIALKPDLDANQACQISYIAGIAVLESILTLNRNIDIKLKWVNDILIREKKVAGILIEKVEHDFLLVGIGINVHPNPDITKLGAASLEDFHLEVNHNDFQNAILSKFQKHYNNWIEFGYIPIRNLWLQNAYGIGRNITVNYANGSKDYGIFLDINETGNLLLLDQQNQVKKISAGEIFF